MADISGMYARLDEDLAASGITLDDEKKDLVLKHLLLVINKNKELNLTRITDETEAVTLHVVDSLVLLAFVEQTKGRILDIGTGAGFPGIPLALTTDRETVLMDSVAKKVKACAEFVQTLGYEDKISTTSERAETFAQTHERKFGCVVARAVAQLGILVEYATPYLKTGGRLVVTKGNPTDEEVTSANKTAHICGMSLVERVSCELPHGLGHREVFVYERSGKSQVKLPRRNGEAKKHPLG